ncbi:MAG: S41 family peptidase [Pyrinomonadaceae bacterium]|nr:S41 family peptidase [Pyrinomonadaceae bacterium]MBP6212804.1 S41 family peptidase [Pyrinomonadaceae bacterium]
MNKKFPVIALVLVGLSAALGGLFGRMPMRTSAGSEVTPERISSEYLEALELVNENYVGKADADKVADSAMQSMLWTLDPHSSFFTREEFRKLDEEQTSQFYGIGVSILQHRDGVYVQSVVPGTPADKAGLRYGDRFLSVEGKDAKEWSSSEVSKNVRGEKGTPVRIQIDRVGSKPIDVELVRGGVPLPSIRNYFMLSESVGYIGLTGGFQQTTGEELKSSIADLKKQGMKSLVLDLRGNPGGILEQAVQVVSKFIPGGKTVVSVKGSRSSSTRELKSYEGSFENFPLVVMINGGSASAAEIVAGAVQDYGRGLVIGNDSFGKGLVQRVFRLPFGNGLTLTTARYYTPYGRSLQRDYSSGSIYDYYTHFADSPENEAEGIAPKPAGSPVTMPDGRVLFGGRGIEPDVTVEQMKSNPLRSRINEAAFFFVRQVVAGKIAGLESFRTEKQSFKQNVTQADFQVNDRLIDAFISFTVADKANGLTAENINSQIEYTRMRIREELATANYSTEAGVQVLLENDPQILKAIESMTQAAKLMENATVMRS